MRTLKVVERTVLKRQSSKWFKEDNQVSIIYDGREHKNHYEDINNPRLRVKFETTFETRSKKDLMAFYNKLGRTERDKFIKSIIDYILGGRK